MSWTLNLVIIFFFIAILPRLVYYLIVGNFRYESNVTCNINYMILDLVLAIGNNFVYFIHRFNYKNSNIRVGDNTGNIHGIPKMFAID